MSADTQALPPGPRLPRALQTLGFMAPGSGFMERSRRRYGDAVTFSTLFDARFVVVFTPELVRSVYRAPPDRLRAGEANAILEPVVGRHSLLTLDGAEHLRQRRLMLPPFHGERMRAYRDSIVTATDRAIDSWPVGERFALLPHMQAITLEVIMRAVIGLGGGERAAEMQRRIRALIEPATQPVGALLLVGIAGRVGRGKRYRRFLESRRSLDEILYEEIAARRAADDLEEREDVLSMLVAARDEHGEAMSDEELRDELVTLLAAGHETTATGLSWTFELLLREPRVLERLRAELGRGDDAYLDAVVKEALRLRPVVAGVGRVVCGEPFELGGYRVPVGVEINPSIRVIHQDDERFPQAERFMPERFLGEDAPDTYTWTPFGGGTRRCIGASFALMEMREVVRRVVERTELVPAGRRRERVQRRGITLGPRSGVRVMRRA